MRRPLPRCGGVADGILAAHLVLQFLESLVEGMLSINAEDPPSRLVGHPPQFTLAATSTTERAIRARVNVVEAVESQRQTSGPFDRLTPRHAAALVHAVSD